MKVRVIKRAFIGGRIVEPGSIIEVPEGTTGSAFVSPDADVVVEPAKPNGVEALFGPAIPKPPKAVKAEEPKAKPSPL